MRQGELLALKWQDVDLWNATISVRRTLTKSEGRLLLGEPKAKEIQRPFVDTFIFASTIELVNSPITGLCSKMDTGFREHAF
jgi:integrase